MIAPAPYFHTITNGNYLANNLGRYNLPRPIGLYGDENEIVKLVSAARCKNPFLIVLRQEQYRQSTLHELDAEHQTTLLVVQATEPGRYLDRFEINKTPYRPLQILSALVDDIERCKRYLPSFTRLVEAEIHRDLSLSEQLELARHRARIPWDRQAHYLWAVDQLLHEINGTSPTTPLEEHNMNKETQSFEAYKAARQEILYGTHKAQVKQTVDLQNRLEREAYVQANPDQVLLDATVKRRSELASEGRSTVVHDEVIVDLQSKLSLREKQAAFKSSTTYETTLPIANEDRRLVELYDPDQLFAVDAAIARFEEHMSPEKLFGELASASRQAFVNESKQRRQAEQDAAKAELDFAKQGLQRATNDAETQRLLASTAQLNQEGVN